MIEQPQRLPDPNTQWIDPNTGKPTREYYQYLRDIDDRLRKIIALLNVEFP